MPDRPLLLLPTPSSPAARAKKHGGGVGPAPLSAGRQSQRLQPRLAELEQAFAARRVELQTDTTGIAPEDVLVLETAGAVEDFLKAVSRIDGMEFLAEYDEEDIPPDDDFFVEKRDGRHVSFRGRVYLVFANQTAFQQLLRLWRRWQHGDGWERGWTKWRDVFSLLRNIRPWGLLDRLEETGVLRDWAERMESGAETLPCEVELWFRHTPELRNRSHQRVVAMVEGMGGEVRSSCQLGGIRYHALGVTLPTAAIQRFVDEGTDLELLQCEQIQFFRASGQMAAELPADPQDDVSLAAALSELPMPEKTPVVALLDGLPLQQHQLLAGRLSVDDPDNYEAEYLAHARLHGTAMASMIVWGDLGGTPIPIPQRLYVRPILYPVYPPDWVQNVSPWETVRDDVLVVDLIHRAVRRILVADGEEPAAAPDVCVINLSIGIADRLFEGTMSPLARLLDWLSWEYDVLFCVSAGNHKQAIELGQPWSAIQNLSPEDLRDMIVKSFAADSRNRRLLSPAEAVNVLTVGALHADEGAAPGRTHHIDPLPHPALPNLVNAHGMGFRRSIKPDLLLPGGRVLVRTPVLGTHEALVLELGPAGPGQMVATPGSTPGQLAATTISQGTSNATALATRTAAFAHDLLDELRAEPGGEVIDSLPRAVWLKALVVHGARWAETGQYLRRLLRTPNNGRQLTEYLTRLIGYGAVDARRALECSAHRVTALGGGKLRKDQGIEHRLPLPPSLSGKRGAKSLTITLAWISPVNPRHYKWRRADLWFTKPDSKLTIGKILRRSDADWRAVQRGTVQHETFEGDQAAAFIDGDEVVVRVSCREDAGVLEDEVPYAIAVTLEVAVELGIDIYSEVRTRILNRLQIAPAP